MKRTLIKILGKHVLAAATLTGMVFMIVPTQAKATTNNIEILSDNNQATVQYIGSVEDGLYFSVKLDNPNGDKFTLVIKDQNGSELYVQNYSDKKFFKRKIKLLKK